MDKLQFLVIIFPVLLSKLCNVSLCNFIKYIKAVFSDSIDGGDLSHNIVENYRFELYVTRWGPLSITVPNLIRIGQKVAEIWRFNGFKMAAVRHLGFVIFKFFNGRSG